MVNFLPRDCIGLLYNKIFITELPIKTWTEPYKQFLEDCIINKKIDGLKNIRCHYTESEVNFELEVDTSKLKHWIELKRKEGNVQIDVFEKMFKLTSKISTSNMHLIDHNNKIRKYANELEIMEDFYAVRVDYYNKRKQYQLDTLKSELELLSEKVRFILAVIDESIPVKKSTKDQLIEILKQQKFTMRSRSKDESPSYQYLIGMPIYQMTIDMVNQLRAV